MTRPQFVRSLLVVGVATPLVFGTLLLAGQGTTVDSYTGCLTSGGTLVSVAVGDAPQSPCGPSQTQIRLGGGNITAVNAGPGLEGGSTNGVATLSLLPSYQLPQTCSAGRVARWTGSSWSCGIDADSDPVAIGGFSALGFISRVAVPDELTVIRRLPIAAGKYAISAKMNVSFMELDSDYEFIECQLIAGSDVDTAHAFNRDGSMAGATLTLMLLHEFGSDGIVDLACRDSGNDELFNFNDAEVYDLRVTAIRLGAFQNSGLVH